MKILFNHRDIPDSIKGSGAPIQNGYEFDDKKCENKKSHGIEHVKDPKEFDIETRR